MRLRFPEAKILEWAKRYNYSQEETSLLELRPEVRRAGFLTKAQLQRVAKWKSPRSAGWMKSNEESYVQEITSLSLSANTERGRIELLTLLDGVQWASASVILHLFHDQKYPILDFRALWSVIMSPESRTDFCRK